MMYHYWLVSPCLFSTLCLVGLHLVQGRSSNQRRLIKQQDYCQLKLILQFDKSSFPFSTLSLLSLSRREIFLQWLSFVENCSTFKLYFHRTSWTMSEMKYHFKLCCRWQHTTNQRICKKVIPVIIKFLPLSLARDLKATQPKWSFHSL